MVVTVTIKRWVWGASMVTGLVLLAAGSIPLWGRSRGTQSDLAVREESGSLLVSWNQALYPRTTILEIIDGKEQTLVAVTPNLSSVTYQPRSDDVQIRLGADAVRFVQAGLGRRDAKELETEAERLTAIGAIQTRRIAELEKMIAAIQPRR